MELAIKYLWFLIGIFSKKTLILKNNLKKRNVETHSSASLYYVTTIYLDGARRTAVRLYGKLERKN